MKEEVSEIKKHSPNLYGVLSRCKEIEISQLLEFSFALSIKYGGLEELDFKREEGVSYNPRPARIALIIINDAKVINLDTLIKAFLTTIDIQALSVEEKNKIESYLDDYQLIAANINNLLVNDCNSGVAIISLARHLDRIRHRHLAKEKKSSQSWINFIEETEKYLLLAKIHSKELYTLIEFWLTRAKTR